MKDLRETFKKNPVMSQFSKIDLSKFCQHLVQEKYLKNQIIFNINDEVNHYYLVESGEVTITNELGESRTIYTGDSFGDECIIGLSTSFCMVIAATNAQVAVINKQIIQSKSSKSITRAQDNLFYNLSKLDKRVIYKDNSQIDKPYILNLLFWIITIIGPSVIAFLLLNIDHPPNKSQLLLIYLFLSAACMWCFRLAPEFVPALYLLLGSLLLSLVPPSIILSGFYSNAFFLAIALSVLAIIIEISGLSYRILLYSFYHLGSHKIWRHFILFFSGASVTPIIPSSNSRAGIIYPLFQEALALHKIKKGSKEYQRLVASTIGGFSLLSPMFLTSKSVNILVLGMLSIQDQYGFQFYYWFVSAAVVGLIVAISYLLLVWLLFRNDENYQLNTKSLATQIKVLGKITTEEVFAIIAIFTFLTIVLTSSIHNLESSWLALLLVVFLFILGVFKRMDFNRSVDWGFLIFLSALLGFTSATNYLEVHLWMAHYTLWISELIESSFIQFSLALSGFIFVLRLFLPINITVILLASILIPIVSNSGVSPWLVIFIILLMSESYTYNFSASFVVQFVSLIGDQKTYPRLIALQLIIYVVKCLAVIASIPYWQSLGILTS